jgi:hypothetical protein
MTVEQLEASVMHWTPRAGLAELPPLPAELQQVLDLYDLPEREAVDRLGISCHEYCDRLRRVLKIIAPIARTVVADGAGI